MSSNGSSPFQVPSNPPTTADSQNIILQLQNENLSLRQNLSEWHATAMKWQGENSALFADNQRLFTVQQGLQVDYERVLEAQGPQAADLIRQLKEKDDKISKLMSDNVVLAKHNNALKQKSDELKKENEQLLKVITCSRNEATFNRLSIDYQKAMEANHSMANELHSAREEVRRVRGELDFLKNAHNNVLAQVKALESAGHITVSYAGRMPGPAAPANQVLRSSSNTTSPVTPVHHTFSPNGSSPMQAVPQASAMPMMAPPTISQTRRYTAPGVIPVRLPQPRPPQIQTHPQSQPYLPTPRSTIPSPAQVLVSQQSINSYPSQLVQQPRPLQVVIPPQPTATIPENQQFQSPSQGSAMPAYISQYLAQSPVASTSTQIQPPLPPQRHSPQINSSPSQMHTPQYPSLSQSPSEHRYNAMPQVYPSPLDIQPPQEQSPAAIIPVATEQTSTSSVTGEIPSNPADAEVSRNQTLREEFRPEVEVEVNAPPTPPRSYKSMSPEESIAVNVTLKRSPSPSVDFGEGSGNRLGDDRRKRMRLEEPDGGAEEQAGNEATVAPETHADMGVSNTEAESRMGVLNAEAGSSTNGSLSAAALDAATAATRVTTSSPLASDTAEEEEEEVQPDLQRGPDGLYKEEEVVPHMFEDSPDGASYCPFCLIIERHLKIPPRNFAGLPLHELLSHYKEKHSPILAKVCYEGLDMLYMAS